MFAQGPDLLRSADLRFEGCWAEKGKKDVAVIDGVFDCRGPRYAGQDMVTIEPRLAALGEQTVAQVMGGLCGVFSRVGDEHASRVGLFLRSDAC